MLSCSQPRAVKALKTHMLTGYLFDRLRFWFCLLAIVFLTACSAGVASRESPIQSQGPFSASGKQALPERWWETFADPSLNQLVERALSENLTLQKAWARLDQARAVARKAGADIWPQLNAEAGFSSTRSSNNSQTSTEQNYSLGLAASFEIDLWGRISSSREAARLDSLGSLESLKTAALTLTAQIASTWFQLLEQTEQIELLEQQMDTNLKTLELVTLQFRTGQVGIADLLQQRQVVESRRGALSLATAQQQVLQNQLAVLLGEPPVQFRQPKLSRLGTLPPLPATGLQSDLLERRPDIREAWLRLQATDQRIASAVAERFPRLSLTARTSTSGEDMNDLFDNWLATLTANLLAPIIDGGRRQAEVDRTQAVAEEALHAYGQAVLEALAEVEDALVQEQRQVEYLASLNRQLELAEQATERIRERYLNGAENYQRVLTSLLSEQQLQRTRLSARSDLFANRIKLCRALAGGWEMSR